MVQVPNNNGNVSSTSGTRKVGYPFHQNVGILTPRVPQHNIPYNPGPQQPHVNIFSIIFDNAKFKIHKNIQHLFKLATSTEYKRDLFSDEKNFLQKNLRIFF